ncbi:hypothetical protein H0H87_000762 [Tephrocybe sp. NHM501043]|nr:hypothetical protein H0H87_000762 [Tephrocybe sp. NHM501043]
MHEAAVGCKSLDAFFTPRQLTPAKLSINDGLESLDQAQEALKAADEDGPDPDVEILATYEEWWGWTPNGQTNNEPTSRSAVDITGATGAAASAGSDTILTDPTLPCPEIASEDWLDIRDEEAEECQGLAVSIVVQKLIAAAKRHKLFPALFKLQAIQKYLELTLRYSHNPNIKNLQM